MPLNIYVAISDKYWHILVSCYESYSPQLIYKALIRDIKE